MGLTRHAVVSFKGQSGESEYNPKVSQTVWMSTPSGVESHYWTEQMLTDIPLPSECPLGTPTEELNMMANTVVTTMASILFAETGDKDKSFEQAYQLWSKHCESRS